MLQACLSAHCPSGSEGTARPSTWGCRVASRGVGHLETGIAHTHSARPLHYGTRRAEEAGGCSSSCHASRVSGACPPLRRLARTHKGGALPDHVQPGGRLGKGPVPSEPGTLDKTQLPQWTRVAFLTRKPFWQF